MEQMFSRLACRGMGTQVSIPSAEDLGLSWMELRVMKIGYEAGTSDVGKARIFTRLRTSR